MTQMNLSMKQTHRHKEQTCGCWGGEGMGKGKMGVWDQQVQTSMYTMDKQQSPCCTAQGTLFNILQ